MEKIFYATRSQVKINLVMLLTAKNVFVDLYVVIYNFLSFFSYTLMILTHYFGIYIYGDQTANIRSEDKNK